MYVSFSMVVKLVNGSCELLSSGGVFKGCVFWWKIFGYNK